MVAVADSARLDAVLLPYQTRWVADQSRVKVVEKSRRTGFSWTEAADSALEAARANGQDTWYIGYTLDMAREFIADVANWAKAFSYAASEIEDAGDVLEDADKEKGVMAFRIVFASGHKVVALSSQPRNLRSKQGRVVLDEFAFHTDPAGLLKSAMALLIWGGRVIIISTHLGADNAFNELVNDIRAGRRKYSLHRVTFEDALAEGLSQRVALKIGVEWTAEWEAEWKAEIYELYKENADEELHCVPSAGTGIYFPSVLVEARMVPGIPVLRWRQTTEFAMQSEAVRTAVVEEWLEENVRPHLSRLNPNWLSAFGVDFGRHMDLTCIWPLQVRGDLVRVTPFVVELGNMPHECQKQILFYIVDALPRLLGGIMDAGGSGSWLAEVTAQKYGTLKVQQLQLSERWYLENMPRYKAAFEDGDIIAPRDNEILQDHRAFRLVKGIPKLPDARTTTTNGQKRHGDAAIGGALAFIASSMEAAEYGYTPVSALAGAGARGGPHDLTRDFWNGGGRFGALRGTY